jgi:VWFA-related protein
VTSGRARAVAAAFAGSVLVALAVRIGGQQPPLRTSVNFVSVDVAVTAKAGTFVSDLTQQDFEIAEQGQPQKIETFKLVSLDGGLLGPPVSSYPAIRSDDDERREAAREDTRLFAFFLDDYHVSRESSLGSREQLARFIITALGPSDLVEVMYPSQALSSLLLTRDHDAVQKTLERFTGRAGDYTPTNAAEANYSFRDPPEVERVRTQVSRSALDGLITHLGGLSDVRKTLILVTENLGGSSLDLQELYTHANRENVSIYWVDPRRLGALAGSQSLRQAALRSDFLSALSLYTDGRAIANTNDLTINMKNIVADASAYYLLGYSSTRNATDGKFHDIAVRVKRPGTSVRARKGYWALPAEQGIKP